MADQKPDDVELDEDGNPIKPADEGAGDAPKITPKDDQGDDANLGKDGDDNTDDVIPVRKSSLQHIIARKNRTIDKLRSRNDNDVDDDGDDNGDDDDDKESLTPEARRAIRQELEPVTKLLVSQSDEAELSDLLDSEPDAKKLEGKIRKYMEHPSYKGVPPVVIYHHLAHSTAEARGARRKQAADLEANQTRGGGRSTKASDVNVDGIPTAEELDNMTDEEFEQLQNDARSGKYVKKPQE